MSLVDRSVKCALRISGVYSHAHSQKLQGTPQAFLQSHRVALLSYQLNYKEDKTIEFISDIDKGDYEGGMGTQEKALDK